MQVPAGKSIAAAIQNNKHRIPFRPLQPLLQGVSFFGLYLFLYNAILDSNNINARGGAPYGEKSGLLHQQQGFRLCGIHSLGDVNIGNFGPAKPRYMRNLMLAIDENRKALGLDDFRVVTEATHWSGVHNDVGDPTLLNQYPVPMMDIEVGSEPESWENQEACHWPAL